MIMPPKTYTVTEAADILGMARQDVHRWIKELSIKAKKTPTPFNPEGFVYYLTDKHLEQIRNRPDRRGRPRKKKID